MAEKDERPWVDFVKVSGGYLWHIKDIDKHEALCGFQPKRRSRSFWTDIYKGRPYYPTICVKCAMLANISPSISPDDAKVRYKV
jgi:hypothetical protein